MSVVKRQDLSETSVGSVGSLGAQFSRFRPLPPRRPIAPALPSKLLPPALRPWLTDIAERMQVPLELVAAPALVGLSSVVGRRVGIHPKADDDWLVVPNLWGGLIARPGRLKSPALAETLKPVHRLAAASREHHKAMCIELGAEVSALKAQKKALNNLLRKAYEGKKDAGDPAKLKEQLQEVDRKLGEFEKDLAERRYVVNDTTVEKLGELLAIHPQGLLLERDELAGWLRALERDDRKGDREFFLEAWNGLNAYTYDRIGRGTIHIPALCISIIGGIQPTKLDRFVSEALAGGYAADGLLQRFQLLVWPEEDSEWELVDRPPDLKALETVCKLFTAIDEGEVGNPDQGNVPFQVVNPFADAPADAPADDNAKIRTFRFDEEAQNLFYAWLTELELRLRSPDLQATPAFESHLAKYRSLMPSLALLFHLLDLAQDKPTGPVSLTSAKLAADWCDFLELHARKVYADELEIGLSSAHALAEKIKKGEIRDGMTVREIYTKGWSNLATAEDAWEAVEVLVEHGWLRVEAKKPQQGRPSSKIRLNPRLMEGE